jgi:pectin methylesterase-like acyl-CoA thioesterase
VTIRDTALPAAVRTTQPWADMSPNLWTNGRFFEYGNTGPGAAITDPSTRPQLSDSAAADHTPQAYLAGTDGWNPTS